MVLFIIVSVCVSGVLMCVVLGCVVVLLVFMSSRCLSVLFWLMNCVMNLLCGWVSSVLG